MQRQRFICIASATLRLVYLVTVQKQKLISQCRIQSTDLTKIHKKTSLSVLSIEHLFIKWSSIRRYSLTYEKVITVLYLKLSPCVCVSGGGRGPGGSESPGSWASRGQGAWVMIGSKGSGDHGAMGIKGMMSVKEHGAWFGVSMEARKVQGPGHLGGRGPG